MDRVVGVGEEGLRREGTFRLPAGGVEPAVVEVVVGRVEGVLDAARADADAGVGLADARGEVGLARARVAEAVLDGARLVGFEAQEDVEAPDVARGGHLHEGEGLPLLVEGDFAPDARGDVGFEELERTLELDVAVVLLEPGPQAAPVVGREDWLLGEDDVADARLRRHDERVMAGGERLGEIGAPPFAADAGEVGEEVGALAGGQAGVLDDAVGVAAGENVGRCAQPETVRLGEVCLFVVGPLGGQGCAFLRAAAGPEGGDAGEAHRCRVHEGRGAEDVAQLGEAGVVALEEDVGDNLRVPPGEG